MSAIEQMQQSDLSEMELVIMMLDGVVLSDGLVATVALGIDNEGAKSVLGFQAGSSESSEFCKDLLSNLSRRGLSVDEANRRLLAVLDGSDALCKALLGIFTRQRSYSVFSFTRRVTLKAIFQTWSSRG